MKDPRVAKFIDALKRRFPGTTMIVGPSPDAPHSGETYIRMLNSPAPYGVVDRFAQALIWDLWGDEPWPASVYPVSPQDTATYYSHLVRKPRRAATPRSRRAVRPAAKRRAKSRA
jgi:hypothetical protein